MSIKNNEIPKKLKEEILSQLKQEQDKFMQNVERKMEEHNNALRESIKKFEENKDFIEKILSNKYYFEKLESLDQLSTKLNDGILAHEIRISKNISDINALRTKYDKIVLDNLLLPGQIGPSCQFKNLSQYLKNNIYDMTRMKADNETIKNIGNELKIRHETNTKNITDLINNSVTRSNQYTDSRLNDCIVVLENKLKEMNEKLMEMRMKSIQSQEKLQEEMDNFKQNFENHTKIQDNKILICNNMLEALNLRLPEEENILKSIKKLKSKLHNIKEFLLEFIDTYQPNPNNNIINNNNTNQSQQVRIRRNSMILEGMSDNNLEKVSQSPRRDLRLNSRKEESLPNKERINLLSPLRRQRQSTNLNFMNNKFKSNQKANIKLRLINISENSSDDNEDKNESKKSKNLNIKKNLNNNNEKMNNYDSKKNKNKSNKSNRLDKGSKNKNNIKTKNNKNESKILKKENSNFNSFDSDSDSSDNNYSKEKDKVMDIKSKKRYHNKKNTERILIQAKTISQQDKNTNTSNNNSKINNNSNILTSLIDNYNNKNILPINRFKNTYQSSSRNFNNQISNGQYSNYNSQTDNFYRTQQEEKKEIIKDFFSKYDKNTIQDNLNLIKNRGNLDLYNYSVSPPDKNHFLDTKNDEIFDPPISKELFNKKNKQFSTNIKISKIPKIKYNIKLNSGNNLETNNKKLGTMYNISNLGNNNFINNKKTEYSNKFTNTYRGSLKMNSMNSSNKI